ncbi:VapE domain-containing protein [Segatella copri]|uniref:VapE domain-containing protein n=1 Tax=Segatella copri TaxID=165179 RepID=UPI00294B465D|nr:VapE domain-containing protein [Segatella copri]WOG31211.1 VapE family protein [Segatella copri]
MKITVIRTNRQHQLCVTNRSIGHLLERMLKDDSKSTIQKFRDMVPSMNFGYDGFKDMPTWHRVYPAAEFQKDENGNLRMKAFNGLLLLSFRNILKPEDVQLVKKQAAFLPSTLIAVTGADGRSVEILVKFTDEKGELPTDEEHADRLYQSAYRHILPIYQSVIHAEIASQKPSIRSNFLLTLDTLPYYNPQAVALKVDEKLMHQETTPSIPEAKSTPTDKKEKGMKGSKENIEKMMKYLNEKYELRYNMVMKYTEYVPKDKEWIGFQAVEPRVQKSLTLEVQLAGINVSIKDVRNFLESNFIKNYNPVEEFLFTCYDNWDGKDHIRALARTVPTNNPHWEDWFYTWFLAMVEQWHNRTGRQYGNSVAPLLISKQGYNKSTFCRRLIPPQLQWGYTDNLILSEKRQVLQAMSQCLLINLDEFNQISAKVQQGFLKNLIQLPNVKYKPPYGSHVQEFPRTASFIATSNMDDILTDPSGNRRFIGIELTGPIDVSVRPNYQQLFAQAEKAIWNGEKTYFDAEQTALIMENNRRYQQIDPVMQCFCESFTPTEDENEGTFMTAAAIFSELKAKYGASLEAKSLLSFGRCLKNIDGLKRKRTMKGTEYLVIRRK